MSNVRPARTRLLLFPPDLLSVPSILPYQNPKAADPLPVLALSSARMQTRSEPQHPVLPPCNVPPARSLAVPQPQGQRPARDSRGGAFPFPFLTLSLFLLWLCFYPLRVCSPSEQTKGRREGPFVKAKAKINSLNSTTPSLSYPALQLTLLPALEILDLSRNKLLHFPPLPGRLLSLRVLSLSQNRLTALPLYLADFTDLRVFKIDGNPLTFPDAALLRFRQGEVEEREWIDALREFLRVERDEGTSLPRYEETAPLGSTSPQTRAVQGPPLLDDGEDDDVMPLNARLPGAGPPGGGNQQHRRVESSESGRSRVDLKDLVAMGQASQHRRMESSGSGSGRSRGDAGGQGGQGLGRGGGHRREDSDASLRGQVEVRSMLVDVSLFFLHPPFLLLSLSSSLSLWA